MKKLISVLTAVFLVCVTCVTAMAAISSPAKEVIPIRGTVITTDGQTLTINDADTLRKYLEIRNTDRTAEDVAGYSALTVFDVVFHGIIEADVVLYMPGIKAGDKVIVRMYIDGKWVDIEAEAVADNQLRVHLKREGTVEVLKAVNNNGGNSNTDKPGNNANGNNSSAGTKGKNSSSKSPKTGEGNAFPVACTVFVLCALTAVTAKRKATRN